jgi:hypothetical protein
MHLISMTNKKLTLTMLLFVLICISFVFARPVQAQASVSAGVYLGNELTNKIIGLFTSSSGTVTVPDDVVAANNTSYYKVAITAVSGADVTLKSTWYFKNGTEITREGHVNVETSIYDGDFWAIFASNLKAGDLVRPSGPGAIFVNSTGTRTYPGGERETNKMSLDLSYAKLNDTSQTFVRHTITEFDKQTGMLVSIWDQSVFSTYTATIVWELTDSNVWTAPEFPVVAVLPIFMAASALAVIALKKKRVNAAGLV